MDTSDENTIGLRAIWSPDYRAGDHVPPPAETGLDPVQGRPAIAAMDKADRHQIVVLTSAFDGYAWDLFSKFVPEPIHASMVMLSPSQWAHVAAQGRDHYVRIVYEGKLKDFGHRASLVKVSERRFEKSPSGDPVAYLRQYMYIFVREPEKIYANEALENAGLGMPCRRIRLTTLVTPPIDFPYAWPSGIPTKPGIPTDPGHMPRSFWVMVGGEDFKFHGFAKDVAGNPVDFTKTMIFVPNSETQFADRPDGAATPGGRPPRVPAAGHVGVGRVLDAPGPQQEASTPDTGVESVPQGGKCLDLVIHPPATAGTAGPSPRGFGARPIGRVDSAWSCWRPLPERTWSARPTRSPCSTDICGTSSETARCYGHIVSSPNDRQTVDKQANGPKMVTRRT